MSDKKRIKALENQILTLLELNRTRCMVIENLEEALQKANMLNNELTKELERRDK